MLEIFLGYSLSRVLAEYIHISSPTEKVQIFETQIVFGGYQHTHWFPFFVGTFHRRNGFYIVQTVLYISLL